MFFEKAKCLAVFRDDALTGLANKLPNVRGLNDQEITRRKLLDHDLAPRRISQCLELMRERNHVAVAYPPHFDESHGGEDIQVYTWLSTLWVVRTVEVSRTHRSGLEAGAEGRIQPWNPSPM
jgi:hypothetical protein